MKQTTITRVATIVSIIGLVGIIAGFLIESPMVGWAGLLLFSLGFSFARD